MEYLVKVTSTYAVCCPEGGELTDAKGMKETLEAGKQYHFTAQSDKWYTTAAITLTKCSTFKRAALALGLLGGGVKSELPAGYLRAEFLERTKTSNHAQSIVLPSWFNPAVDTVRIETSHNGYRDGWLGAEGSYRPIGFSYGLSNKDALWMSGNAHGSKVGVVDGSDGKYHTWAIESTPALHSFFVDGNKYHEDQADYSSFDGFCFSLFECHNAGRAFIGKKQYWNLDVNGKAVARLLPVLDVAGVPCMLNTVDKGTHYAETTVNFIAGFTLAQARKLGAHLPATKGSLTVSLPWEAQLVQSNAEVEASLETAKSKGWTITVQYREPEEDSVLNTKYAECETIEDLNAVNAAYKSDVTADGVWKWKLSSLKTASAGFSSANNIRRFEADLPELEYAPGFIGDNWGNANLVYFKAHCPKLTNGNGLCQYRKGLREAYITAPMCNSFRGAFNQCQLNKESVLTIANSILVNGGLMTIGIHVDHEGDEEILEAFARLESMKWTLSVQWNGTPSASTASTYGLRRKPVYAKLGEPMEDGTQHLDWGHYVTNWAENGYQEFSSLEEAQEHFNIGE